MTIRIDVKPKPKDIELHDLRRRVEVLEGIINDFKTRVDNIETVRQNTLLNKNDGGDISGS